MNKSKCWQCETEFEEDGIKFCPTCQPWRPIVHGRVEANMKDGSSARKMGGGFVSQKYYDGLSKRSYKKSEKAKHEDGDVK
jgi:hypothetical protein